MNNNSITEGEKPGTTASAGDAKRVHLAPRASCDKLTLLVLFLLLWGACVACVILTRGPRTVLPDWLVNLRNACLDPKEDDFIAPDDIFAEDAFSFTVIDPLTSTPIPLADLFKPSVPDTDEPAGTEQPHEKRVPEPEAGQPKQTKQTNLSISLGKLETAGYANIPPVPLLKLLAARRRPDAMPVFDRKKYVLYVPADACLVRAGTSIFSKDDSVTPPTRVFSREAYLLLAYVDYHDKLDKQACNMRWVLHAAILAGLVILGFGYCLFLLREEFFGSTTKLMLCEVCLILHVLIVMGCQLLFPHIGGGPSFYLFAMMPLSLAPALISNLLGRRVAVCAALLLSTLTPILVGGTFMFQLFVKTLTYSIAGIIAFQNVQKRKQFLWGGLGIGCVVFLITVFFAWQRELLWIWSGLRPFWVKLPIITTINALVVIIAMFILPFLLEQIFDITTIFTLNELNNRDHPLLERLRNEAPGTYEHSMVVARLASDAARTVGANPKLAEACAYFHDIGKLCDPKKFAENQLDNEPNPHDSLTSLESCAILREHVRYGMKLAKKAGLPKAVRDAVEQHHGDSIITGFYNKACAEARAAGNSLPAPAEYSYDGRRPVRAEVVLVSLADFSEAAIRACVRHWDKPSSREIRAKVEELVLEKIKEKQFDQAHLTLAALHDAIDRIVESLCVIHHVRPEYPAQPNSAASSPAPTQSAPAAMDDTGTATISGSSSGDPKAVAPTPSKADRS